MTTSFQWPSFCYLLEWYVLGVKLSLGHAGFNPNCPTSLPARLHAGHPLPRSPACPHG